MPMTVCASAATMLLAKTIEAEITAHIVARGAGKTICPSEVARALAADWRGLMPMVRAVADDMAGRGHLAVTQKGQAVQGTTAKGPIRLGLPKAQETD